MTKPSDNKDALNWMFNIAYGIAFAAMGFIIQLGFSAQQEHSRRMDELPEKYLLKQDYREDHDRILNAIDAIGIQIGTQGERIEADYNRRMDKLEKILTERVH